jgi:hypothetical protein
MDMKNGARRFYNWNLPDVMIEVGEWIRDNEINVSSMSISCEDEEDDDEISSERWCVLVTYVEEIRS